MIDEALNFTPFLTLVATLFVMLMVGFFAGKLNIVTPTASKNLSKLIITIGQPALIIYSLVRMPYSAEDLWLGLKTLGFGLVLHLLLAGISLLFFIRYSDVDERKLSEFSMVFGNVGFIGIPLLESLFGPTGAFMGAFFVVSFNLILWTAGIALLAQKRPDIKLTPKKALLNYGTVPSAIGFVLFLGKGLLPPLLPEGVMDVLNVCSPVVTQTLSYMASLCTPVSMLIIGALLAGRAPRQIFGSGKVYYLCFVKLLVIPMLTCLVMKLCGFGASWILFAATVTAMPSATTVSMLAELYDINPGYSAQCVGTTSLLSMATMPCIIGFAGWLTTAF